MYYTTTKMVLNLSCIYIKEAKDIPIKLPFIAGNVNIETKGKDYSDIWIYCSGWANEKTWYRFNLKE